VKRGFRLGQIGSASMVALAHGTSDAQKTMGVITLTLITAGALAPSAGPPIWVILSSGLAIGLGTYLGGWRIIRTLGKRVSEIETPQGFAAESSASAVILASSSLGFALSTTQVATGAIFGAGAGRRLAAVRWGVAGQMAVAWVLTLPSAAIVGAVAAWVASTGPAGTVVVAVVAVALAAGIYVASRRRPVTAENVNEVGDDAAVVHEPAATSA
jgi:PiT family inorganic phosphate transporter